MTPLRCYGHVVMQCCIVQNSCSTKFLLILLEISIILLLKTSSYASGFLIFSSVICNYTIYDNLKATFIKSCTFGGH